MSFKSNKKHASSSKNRWPEACHPGELWAKALSQPSETISNNNYNHCKKVEIMIYSSVEDNWMRVVMVNNLAQNLYWKTAKSEFRSRISTGGYPFPFDGLAFDDMEKESCLVGMIMAWSVITLETLVNHALAESISNELVAIKAIEWPAQIIEKLNLKISPRSGLSKKLVILHGKIAIEEEMRDLSNLADELSELRNRIVHDKPFSHIDYEDGEVEIEYYAIKGDPGYLTVRYEMLKEFYTKCDRVKNFIFTKSNLDKGMFDNLNFQGLLSG